MFDSVSGLKIVTTRMISLAHCEHSPSRRDTNTRSKNVTPGP